MKTAADFRVALDEAKNRGLDPVRVAVRTAINQVEAQMTEALLNPNNVSANPVFGDKMPAAAWYKGNYGNFIHLLAAELTPLGYTVGVSHDGGGMYATYAVRLTPEKLGKA